MPSFECQQTLLPGVLSQTTGPATECQWRLSPRFWLLRYPPAANEQHVVLAERHQPMYACAYPNPEGSQGPRTITNVLLMSKWSTRWSGR